MNRKQIKGLFGVCWGILLYAMVAIQVVAQEPSPQASLQKERVVFELLRFEAPVGSAAQLIKRPILNSFLDTAKIISGQKPYKAAILDAKTDSRPRQSGRSLSRGF